MVTMALTYIRITWEIIRFKIILWSESFPMIEDLIDSSKNVSRKQAFLKITNNTQLRMHLCPIWIRTFPSTIINNIDIQKHISVGISEIEADSRSRESPSTNLSQDIRNLNPSESGKMHIPLIHISTQENTNHFETNLTISIKHNPYERKMTRDMTESSNFKGRIMWVRNTGKVYTLEVALICWKQTMCKFHLC